jgi:hypothetical protein
MRKNSMLREMNVRKGRVLGGVEPEDAEQLRTITTNNTYADQGQGLVPMRRSGN